MDAITGGQPPWQGGSLKLEVSPAAGSLLRNVNRYQLIVPAHFCLLASIAFIGRAESGDRILAEQLFGSSRVLFDADLVPNPLDVNNDRAGELRSATQNAPPVLRFRTNPSPRAYAVSTQPRLSVRISRQEPQYVDTRVLAETALAALWTKT
jgi:hypothetical protein